jgi:transcriptional regulator NrdR family protein
MECPFCKESNTGVIDSRPTKDKSSIRRRRQCLTCAGRFTTYEATFDQLMLLLMKTHGGKGGSMKSSDAVLSFMSEALKGLSAECERLMGGVAKFEPAKRVERKVRAKAKKKTPVKKKVPAKKTVAPKRKRAKKLSDTDKVLRVIRGHKKGVDIPKLKKKTGFADIKVRAIVYRASKEGKIKRVRRGVYISQ